MNDYRRIDDLLDELQEIIEESKTGSIFGGRGLDKETIYSIIDDIRIQLPGQIKEAERIISNAEKIIENATYEANKIIKKAEEERMRLTSEHEIVKDAKVEDELIRENTKEYVREMRIGALTYADGCLSKVEKELEISLKELSRNFRAIEDIITNEINTVHKNRQELREND